MHLKLTFLYADSNHLVSSISCPSNAIFTFQDIKALFPQDYNPFYAGFGNRDTDEFSYRKIGIPKGKIFIINPKVSNPCHMLCCQLQDLLI